MSKAGTSRRLLIVSNFHPPSPGAGGTRWAAMARHLRAAGHSVTIVACDAWGVLPDDAQQAVVRVGDLRSSRALRRLLRRGELTLAGASAATVPPPTALLTKLIVPDMHAVTWLPAVLPVVRRLVRRGEVDCLLTTSPPEATHLLGLLLGRRRPAWIADFRDGWSFEPHREPFPTAPQRSLDRWLERRVAASAEVAVGVSREISDDLAERLGASSAWVPNGWDPSVAPPVGDFAPLRAGTSTLVYTGTIAGLRGSTIEPLLRALAIVRDDGTTPPMRLLHAGNITTEQRELIARSGAGDLVEHLGMLARADAYALQRSADALVMVTSKNFTGSTSKVFEYIAAGRPIVALARHNDAERIVQETNTGLTVAPDDVEAIVAALRRVATGELARTYAPRNLERFFYPGPAEAMAELVEQAIRRRRARS